MERYFYHGIEFFYPETAQSIDTVLKILEEGLIMRSKAFDCNDEDLNHVCLYKKNDDIDYNAFKSFESTSMSALDAWIRGGYVFILNPNLAAEKAETSVIDEWRYYGNIPLSEFVGIALPYEHLEAYFNDSFKDPEVDYEELKGKLSQITKRAEELGLSIYDSTQIGFPDFIDEQLQQQKKANR